MGNRISLLIGIKNNLKYTKNFYYTTRLLYPEVEIVVVSYGSEDGTHEWLQTLDKDQFVKYFFSPDSLTLSDTYNKCIRLATRPYVAFVHNDMVIGKGFLESLEYHLKEDKVLFYKVIEPPVFADDHREWKEVRPFGFDIDSFNKDGFASLNDEIFSRSYGKSEIARSGSFFLCASKKVLANIGGLDPLFNPMFREDDDLLIRLNLLNLKMYLVPSAITYHFVSRTSRFSEEYKNVTNEIEQRSDRNFIRKWGFSASSPVRKKYDVGLVIENAALELIREVEPYCSRLYVDCDTTAYISQEQPCTPFLLSKRIRPIADEKDHDILVFMNGQVRPKRNIEIIHRMNELIWEIAQRKPGLLFRKLGFKKNHFRVRNLSIKVRSFNSLEDQLIYRAEG